MWLELSCGIKLQPRIIYFSTNAAIKYILSSILNITAPTYSYNARKAGKHVMRANTKLISLGYSHIRLSVID